jgi:hypothetical protein
MMSVELMNGLVVVTIISVASGVLTPLLCWLLVNHANAVERANLVRESA